MLFSLRIYSLYFAQFFKARMSYRADFFASLIGNGLASLSGILFVLLLIDGKDVPDLRGWSREQILFIFGYSYVATALFSVVSLNLYGFGDRYVIQGQLDRVLLRPLNSLAQVLFESFNIESLANLAVGAGIIIYAAEKMQLNFSALDVLWLLVSTISGAIILLSVFVSVASLSFHFEDRLGLSAPVYNLISFSRYPVNIFNRVIQAILSFVVPFSFVAFYPATHFLAPGSFRVFCYLTPLVSAAAAFLAVWAWKFGVSKYSSTGN